MAPNVVANALGLLRMAVSKTGFGIANSSAPDAAAWQVTKLASLVKHENFPRKFPGVVR
jgi:hypothetical protein